MVIWKPEKGFVKEKRNGVHEVGPEPEPEPPGRVVVVVLVGTKSGEFIKE